MNNSYHGKFMANAEQIHGKCRANSWPIYGLDHKDDLLLHYASLY